MKKMLLSAIFIILTYSVNAQTLVGTSFGQASTILTNDLILPKDFLFYNSIGAMFNNLNNNTDDISLVSRQFCFPPVYVNSPVFIPFPFTASPIACGGLQLPPGKNWSISYSIDLQTSQPATIYGFLYYRQDDTTKTQGIFYNQISFSQALTSLPPTISMTQQGIVLTPIDESKPVYLYLMFQILSKDGEVSAPKGSIPFQLNVTSLD